MGEKRRGARRCGARQTEDLWRESLNEVTAIAGLESRMGRRQLSTLPEELVVLAAFIRVR